MPFIQCLHCGALFRPTGPSGRRSAYCARHQHLATGLLGAKGRDWSSRDYVLERDGWRCTAVVNGKRCAVITGLEVHHITPRRRGGTDDPANLVTLCKGHHPRGDRLSS